MSVKWAQNTAQTSILLYILALKTADSVVLNWPTGFIKGFITLLTLLVSFSGPGVFSCHPVTIILNPRNFGFSFFLFRLERDWISWSIESIAGRRSHARDRAVEWCKLKCHTSFSTITSYAVSPNMFSRKPWRASPFHFPHYYDDTR